MSGKTKFARSFMRKNFSVIFCILWVLLIINIIFGFTASNRSSEKIRMKKLVSTAIVMMQQQTEKIFNEKTENFLTKCSSTIDAVDFNRYSIDLSEPSLEEIRMKYIGLQAGGEWNPIECVPTDHVAIIIPYADRPMHLRTLLNNLFSFMQLQRIHFAIYVIEPLPSQTFNRGKLMNIGFAEAMKEFDWTCAIFHDVDLIPESLHVSYSCPTENPRHLSAYMNKFKYRLPYSRAFHGVIAFTKAQYQKCNGHSNQFWGWGGEDDELHARVSLAGFKVERVNQNAKYSMLKHDADKMNPVNPCRHNLMACVEQRRKQDGLNSLNYKLIKKEKQPLFTWIFVNLLEFASKTNLRAEGVC